MDPETLDQAVRLQIYRRLAGGDPAPSPAETAQALGLPPATVAAAYRRLAERHILVLQPGSETVWMAMPFSAVPTTLRVTAGDHAWWANCAWDALGIPALLHQDAQVHTQCADCAAPLTLEITAGALAPTDALIHFAVPAAHWWDDIGFT